MESKPSPPLSATIVRYATGRLYNHVLGALVTFLRPKLLAPDQFGVWTLLKSVPTWSAYAHLGSRTSLRLLLPQVAARGETERAAGMLDSVFAGSTFLNGLVAIGLLVAAAGPWCEPAVRTGLVFVAAIAILQFQQDFHVSVLRAREEFRTVTRVYYVESTAVALLTIPLLLWLGLPGLFLTVIAGHITVLGWLTWWHPLGVRLRFDSALFRETVRLGFPALATNFVLLAITTADRFVVGALLSKDELGWYGIAILLVGLLTNIPGAAREVLEPRMMRSIETDPPEKVIEEFVLKPFVNTAYLMPFVIGPILLMLPVALPAVLPKYAAGVVPCQILAASVYFLTLSYATHTVIFARGWQWAATRVLLIVLGVQVGLAIGFVRLGWGIPGVALASAIGHFLVFLGLFWVVSAGMGARSPHWGRHIGALCLPFPFLGACLALLKATALSALGAGWLGSSTATVVLLGLLFVFHRWASRRYVLLKPLGR